jgi:hypothetical protein
VRWLRRSAATRCQRESTLGDHPYREWIAEYAGDAYQAAAAKARRHLDDLPRAMTQRASPNSQLFARRRDSKPTSADGITGSLIAMSNVDDFPHAASLFSITYCLR